MRHFLPKFLRRWTRSQPAPAAAAPAPKPAIAGQPVVSLEAAHQAFGRLKTKSELAAAARDRVGPQLEAEFRRYVGWLGGLGYSFASCEEAPLRFDAPRVHLRYDVHVRDLFGVFLLANLHDELQIPGSFQICWEHSRAEMEASPLFLKLRVFDRRYVQFGFHCAPESGWLIEERFAGRSEGLDGFVASGAARVLIEEWFGAFECHGHDAPVLIRARDAADAHLARTAASFARHFGPAATISGHGTPLAAAYLAATRDEPRLAQLAGYLHAVEYLTPERIGRHNFASELTRFDEKKSPGAFVMFENPIDDMEERYRRRVAGGAGFVVLFHPATWTSNHLRPFIDRVTASGWLERGGQG
ncbi:MAG TPA: hypothetical protein VGF07_02625 [Stellaceae bacterium]